MERLFGERIPEIRRHQSPNTSCSVLQWIRENEIGRDEVIETPFGERKVVYCDYSASARAIKPIENYIIDHVLPLYGNTHSSVTVTSEQTTLFVHEARQEIRSMTGAGDVDSVIFTGSGSTAAVELLIHLLQFENLVVIHSIHEHHSNLLPWRNAAKQCYCVGEDDHGRIDIRDLERVLREVSNANPNCVLLATFTACSNVTGVCMDVQLITKVLKRFNCFSVWDYASGAPYMEINVNGHYPLDAIFFSGHKFIGGVSSPGVLIVKKSLIHTQLPKRMGGGTVFYVSEAGECYLKDSEYREEGGTPDSIGIIRLALAVKLKRAIGEIMISTEEERISRIFIDRIQSIPNLILLGAKVTQRRLPVFSFVIKDPASGLLFHHNYIATLLNDLFGIQSRSGCMCAGPYAQYLLGIDTKLAAEFLLALWESNELDRTHLRRIGEYSQQELLRPGFVRVSIPFFWTINQVNDLIDCIQFVSERASDFIHLYQLNCESGEWHHHKQRTFHARKWLGHISFTDKGMEVEEKKRKDSSLVPLASLLVKARQLATESQFKMMKSAIPDGRSAINEHYSHLRWFVLPIETIERYKNINVTYPKLPFPVRTYPTFSEQVMSGMKIKNEFVKLDGSTNTNQIRDTDQVQINGSEGIPSLTQENKYETKHKGSYDGNFSEAAEITECPLNFYSQGKEQLDKFKEDDIQEADCIEDWNRRVIVRRQELSNEEEVHLPWHDPPLKLYKKMADAIHSLNMIKDGDKVLVCLSGGKDSLALLHSLHFYQMRCQKNRSTSFQLGAITVDPGSSAFNPRPLIEYCRSLNIDYFYEEQDIIGAARKLKNLQSICAFCSRMKRGRLAAAAQHHGWNVLAFGQHLDDIVESFFIAAFQNGNLSTMKAHYTTRDGSLRVIRPLIFIREKDLREFSETRGLPIIAENCPACFNQATERHRIKQMLAQQELVFPDLFNSLRSAIEPLILVDSARTNEMRVKAIENIFNSYKGKK